jgi:disulfide bond formation protein DsbB
MSGSTPTRIDPRGPRFAATLTTVVLAIVLVTAPSTTATVLLVVQTVLFAAGALGGVQRTPYAWLFKRLVRPRLGAPTELEDAEPPRFAQTVGLAFALVALAGFGTGVTFLGLVATGFALAAAFLNAAFGFCLGCELYLLARRALPAKRSTITATDNEITTGAGATSVAAER